MWQNVLHSSTCTTSARQFLVRKYSHGFFNSLHDETISAFCLVLAIVFSFSRPPVKRFPIRFSVAQPFVDTSHPVQDFFLPRKYAIAIPTVLVIILITLVATFVGLTLIKSARKQKKKAS